MILLSGLYLSIIISVISLLVIALIIVLVLVLKKKKKHVVVDDEFMDNIISSLGGIDNIKAVLVDNARLKIEVLDIKKPLFDKLKELSGQGVFITGNFIKVLFKFDSKTIKKEIEKRM